MELVNYTKILLCFLAVSNGERIHNTLILDWAQEWGSWGNKDFCSLGTFAYAFQLKVESSVGTGDDTAMNGIRLFCKSSTNTGIENSITSTVQKWGEWRGRRICSDGLLTGIRMRNERSQGDGDDTAANNVEMKCNYNVVLEGGGTGWGHYSGWSSCNPGWAICGLQTRVESEQGSGDDTALNNVRIFCCPT